MLEELQVHGHHIFKVAVNRAVLYHQDIAVALNDLRLDLADLLIQQNLMRQLAINDLLADCRNALRTKRVGAARPAQRRLGLLP